MLCDTSNVLLNFEMRFPFEIIKYAVYIRSKAMQMKSTIKVHSKIDFVPKRMIFVDF